MSKLYKIVVRPYWRDESKFALFNEASGGFAGDRLFKGEDKSDPKQQWPFRAVLESNWVVYDTLSEAEIAAAKLQRYLEAREGKKKPATSKVSK